MNLSNRQQDVVTMCDSALKEAGLNTYTMLGETCGFLGAQALEAVQIAKDLMTKVQAKGENEKRNPELVGLRTHLVPGCDATTLLMAQMCLDELIDLRETGMTPRIDPTELQK